MRPLKKALTSSCHTRLWLLHTSQRAHRQRRARTPGLRGQAGHMAQSRPEMPLRPCSLGTGCCTSRQRPRGPSSGAQQLGRCLGPPSAFIRGTLWEPPAGCSSPERYAAGAGGRVETSLVSQLTFVGQCAGMPGPCPRWKRCPPCLTRRRGPRFERRTCAWGRRSSLSFAVLIRLCPFVKTCVHSGTRCFLSLPFEFTTPSGKLRTVTRILVFWVPVRGLLSDLNEGYSRN